MKKLLKLSLALCGVFMLVSATSANAQKFGYIDVQEILMKMPGLDSVQTKLQRFQADLQGQMEIMQVEYNKKIDDYQKNFSTLSDAVKKDREKDIKALEDRIQEFGQGANEDITAEQEKLVGPLLEKIEAALDKVSKANNILAVFNLAVPSLVYFDKAAMTDMAPLVNKELGIK